MKDAADLSRRRLRGWLRLLRLTRQTENHLREYLRVNHATTLPRFDVMAALYRAGEHGLGKRGAKMFFDCAAEWACTVRGIIS